MRKSPWVKLALAFVTGAALLQAPTCSDTAAGVTALATTVTAGGVIYLVFKVVD